MKQFALLTMGILVMTLSSGCYNTGYQRGPGLFGGPGLFPGRAGGGCGACGSCPTGGCGTGYSAPGYGAPGAVPGVGFYGPTGSATQTSYPTAALPNNNVYYQQIPQTATLQPIPVH